MKDSNEGKHDDAGFASIRNPLFSLANVNKANNKDQAFKSNLDQIKSKGIRVVKHRDVYSKNLNSK